MIRSSQHHAGFTLIELLMVIAMVSILAAAIIPSSSPSTHDQLQNAAQVIAAEVGYCQSLAISNNSTYLIRFDINENYCRLEHSGSDSSLDVLPPSAFSTPDEPDGQRVVRLGSFPTMGIPVRLETVLAMSSPEQPVDTVEFGPIGETTRSEETVIWLTAGSGASQRYLSVRVNPITGLVSIENYQSTSGAAGSGS